MGPGENSVIVTSEMRMVRGPDGFVYTATALPYSFWQRYLSVFSSVTVLARIKHVMDVPVNWLRADGPGVRFADLPYYNGPLEYVKVAGRLGRVVRDTLGQPGP